MINFLMRRGFVVGTAAFLALGTAGAVAQQAQQVAAAGSAEISIQSFQFVPATLTVAPGTAVTWVNRDEEPHNVVSPDRAFRSTAARSSLLFSTNPGPTITYVRYIRTCTAQLLLSSGWLTA